MFSVAYTYMIYVYMYVPDLGADCLRLNNQVQGSSLEIMNSPSLSNQSCL